MNETLWTAKFRALILNAGELPRAVLAEIERECDELLAHPFAYELTREMGQSNPLDPKRLAEFVGLVAAMIRSQDETIHDILFATIFPQLEEHPELAEQFKAVADEATVRFYTDWKADFDAMFG